MAHDVFLSHSSKDKQIADEVLAALETAGIKCWITPRDIGTGEIFPVAIAEAIANSKLMVLIFSENSNTSKDVANELILAMDESIKTIPFRIEDVKPKGAMRYYLTGAQWLEATTPPIAENLQNLVRTVNSHIIDLTPVTLTIDNSNPHDGQVNQAYRFTLQAAGGSAPYEYSITAGKLPNGLQLAADGTLSGIPLQDGTFIFGVQVKDSVSATASHVFTMITEPAPVPLTIDTTAPPDAQIDSEYSFNFKAIGGSAPYNHSITAGKLPLGLKLDSDGTLSGTPEKAGDYAFTVQVEDSKAVTASHRVTLTTRAVTVLKDIPTEPKSKTEDQKSSKPSVFKYREWVVRAAVAVTLVLVSIGVIYLINRVPEDQEMAEEEPVEEPVEVVIDDPVYLINYASGTIPLSDLEIGSRVVDPSWEWTNSTVVWIVVAKNHYDEMEPHVTLLSEALMGKIQFDNSNNRGGEHGSNHWGNSGTPNATGGLRPWLNSTGIHRAQGIYNIFSDNFKSAILTTNLTNYDFVRGRSYITSDKVFIPSATELGDTKHSGIHSIGTVYPYFKDSDDVDRVAIYLDESWMYWTRTPISTDRFNLIAVYPGGSFYSNAFAKLNYYGYRPALNLKANTLVTKLTDKEQAE